MFSPSEITDIVINVLFVATFLTVFFFTYVVKIEGEIVEDQVNYLVKDLSENIKLLPEDVTAMMRQQVKTAPRPDMTKADETVQKNNDEIFWSTIKIVGVALGVGLTGAFVASRYWNFSMMDSLKRNLLILAFIALTEYIFLMTFGRSYRSADPNHVKLVILNKLTGVKTH
jgi:hypothetical protein